jgi:hypothetical protein
MANALPSNEPTEPIVRLHHGTDVDSANDLLVHGVIYARAAAFNVSGEFWATVSESEAKAFAVANPAGGVPARYSFNLPLSVLQALLNSSPRRANRLVLFGVEWYEFYPGSFPYLNRYMANRQVVSPVP